MVLFLKKCCLCADLKKMTNFRIEPTLPFTSPVNKVQFDKQCSLLKDGVMETFGKKRWKLLRTRSLAMNLKSFLLSACFILKVFFVCVQTFIENIFLAVHGCNCSEWKSICIFCALFPRQPRTHTYVGAGLPIQIETQIWKRPHDPLKTGCAHRFARKQGWHTATQVRY